jgi:hypothetical protein
MPEEQILTILWTYLFKSISGFVIEIAKDRKNDLSKTYLFVML